MSWKCVVYHFLWRCFAVVNHKKMWKITTRPQIGWIMLLAPPFSAWNAKICRMTYSPSYLLDCLCLYNWIPEWKRAEWRERENRICCRSPEWFMAKNFAPWDNQINSLCHFHCAAWIFHAHSYRNWMPLYNTQNITLVQFEGSSSNILHSRYCHLTPFFLFISIRLCFIVPLALPPPSITYMRFRFQMTKLEYGNFREISFGRLGIFLFFFFFFVLNRKSHFSFLTYTQRHIKPAHCQRITSLIFPKESIHSTSLLNLNRIRSLRFDKWKLFIVMLVLLPKQWITTSGYWSAQRNSSKAWWWWWCSPMPWIQIK